MAKNERKKSRIVDVIIGLVFALIAAYSALAGIKIIFDKGNFVSNFLDVEGTINWIVTVDEIAYKVIPFMVFIAFFAILMHITSRKENGYKDASKHGVHGDAVFSSLQDLREDNLVASKKESKYSTKDPLKTLESSSGIILGREGDELLIIPPDSELDNRNVLVVGSSGSSKGQAFVINNILNNINETFIVTDPKGELYKLTSDIKRDQGYKVYQVDFLNVTGAGYNPLDYVKNDIDAGDIALSIGTNSAEDDKKDHWFVKAQDLLKGIILYVKSINENANIPDDVMREFNKISESEKYLRELCEIIGEDHISYQTFKNISVATGGERASILSTFTKQVGIFASKQVADLTRKSDFTFYDLQKEKSILYIKIPVTNNPVQALTATFFDQLHKTFYKIGDSNDSKLHIPVYSLYDEFANLGKLNGYDSYLSTCRGYGWGMMTVVQDFAQLEQKYSKELTRTIISNHDTTLFLRTKDIETAKVLEELAGSTTVEYNTKGTSNSGGLMSAVWGGNTSSSRSTTQNIIQRPLISKSELLAMSPRDKCYVFMVGHKVELQKAFQSLIYKDFITKQDGTTSDGKPKYVYAYPEKREAYIKKFNLKPVVDVIENVEEENIESENITKTKSADKKLEVFKEEVKVASTVSTSTATINKEDAIEGLVSRFFSDLEMNNAAKENVPEPSKQVDEVKNEQSSSSERLEEILEEIKEGIKEEFITPEMESDPEALAMLNEIPKIGPRVKETEKLVEDLQAKSDLIRELSSNDEDVITMNEMREELNKEEKTPDELPMGYDDDELPM
jgi:type IV secretion system protein VirD4